MQFSKKGPGQDKTPRRAPATTNNKASVGKSRSTRRTFLMRSAAVVGGVAVGANYMTPNMTTLSIPKAFASTSPLPSGSPSHSKSHSPSHSKSHSHRSSHSHTGRHSHSSSHSKSHKGSHSHRSSHSHS